MSRRSRGRGTVALFFSALFLPIPRLRERDNSPSLLFPEMFLLALLLFCERFEERRARIVGGLGAQHLGELFHRLGVAGGEEQGALEGFLGAGGDEVFGKRLAGDLGGGADRAVLVIDSCEPAGPGLRAR